MKLTIKVALFVSLVSSTIYADGGMENGGKTCTSNCLVATQPTEKNIVKTESEDSILIIVKNYLISIFG
jgi:hypothetical protein